MIFIKNIRTAIFIAFLLVALSFAKTMKIKGHFTKAERSNSVYLGKFSNKENICVLNFYVSRSSMDNELKVQCEKEYKGIIMLGCSGSVIMVGNRAPGTPGNLTNQADHAPNDWINCEEFEIIFRE